MSAIVRPAVVRTVLVGGAAAGAAAFAVKTAQDPTAENTIKTALFGGVVLAELTGASIVARARRAPVIPAAVGLATTVGATAVGLSQPVGTVLITAASVVALLAEKRPEYRRAVLATAAKYGRVVLTAAVTAVVTAAVVAPSTGTTDNNCKCG